MLHMPTPMLMGGGTDDDRSKFIAWAGAFPDLRTSDANTRNSYNTSRVQNLWFFPAVPSGTMHGTPIRNAEGSNGNAAYSLDSVASRLMQHSFQDVTAKNQNLGKEVVFALGDDYGDGTPLSSVVRNDYTSLAGDPQYALYRAQLWYLDSRHPGKIVWARGGAFPASWTLLDL